MSSVAAARSLRRHHQPTDHGCPAHHKSWEVFTFSVFVSRGLGDCSQVPSELRKLLMRLCVVVEELVLVCRVLFHESFAVWLVHQGKITLQFQERGIRFFLHELLEVGVVKLQHLVSPGSLESGTVLVRLSQSVRSGKRDDLSIIESHPVEDISEVAHPLVCVRKTAIRGAILRLSIFAAEIEGNFRPSRMLNRHNRSELIKVSIGDFRKLLLNGLERIHGPSQSIVCSVIFFRGEPDGSVGSWSLGLILVKSSGVVPSKSNHDRLAWDLIVELHQRIGNLRNINFHTHRSGFQ
mmetsp:Transcript_28586/g.111827  ORF Transcript_28586/g.111827 Transcript_28586/m.111827 type:complete len:294 (+) Transcript_28586:90-971(+)